MTDGPDNTPARLLILFAAIPVVAMGCAMGAGNLDPKDLSARERSVQVYQAGERPECRYDPLGTVEATSGTALEIGTYASSIAKMQRSAAALGATGVMVIDHSKNQMADQTTGLAIRCKFD